MARMIGCSRWTVVAIETGRRQPSFDMMDRIRRVTSGQVSADDMLTFCKCREKAH